jgi:PIN domain nuclease of toxin-antitoxin system
VRLLLDTHIWLWSLLDTHRLVRRVVRALESEDNELWLSPISVWEAAMLVERRRVVLEGDFDAWLREALAAAPIREAVLTHDIAAETRRVVLSHRDPADRFLIATARVLDLTLVTGDERLLGAAQVATLANR